MLEDSKACPANKAPGPNGNTMGSFISWHDIVKEDIINTIQNFYSEEYIEKRINTTYVALSPKKVGALELKDFRPLV